MRVSQLSGLKERNKWNQLSTINILYLYQNLITKGFYN